MAPPYLPICCYCSNLTKFSMSSHAQHIHRHITNMHYYYLDDSARGTPFNEKLVTKLVTLSIEAAESENGAAL